MVESGLMGFIFELGKAAIITMGSEIYPVFIATSTKGIEIAIHTVATSASNVAVNIYQSGYTIVQQFGI